MILLIDSFPSILKVSCMVSTRYGPRLSQGFLHQILLLHRCLCLLPRQVVLVLGRSLLKLFHNFVENGLFLRFVHVAFQLVVIHEVLHLKIF